MKPASDGTAGRNTSGGSDWSHRSAEELDGFTAKQQKLALSKLLEMPSHMQVRHSTAPKTTRRLIRPTERAVAATGKTVCR